MQQMLQKYAFTTRMLQLCCMAVLALLIPAPRILANDGLVDVVYGGVTLRNGKNATVQMDSEYVEIRLYNNYYTVAATFWLRNSGKKQKVQIGFPHTFQNLRLEALDTSLLPNSLEQLPLDSIFIVNFSTFINDSVVGYTPYRECRLKMELRNEEQNQIISLKSPKDVARWWASKGKRLSEQQRASFHVARQEDQLFWFVKKVNFPKKQTVKTAVEFRAKYMDPSAQFEKQGRYIFGSGCSWKNNIQKSVFRIVNLAHRRTGFSVRLPKEYQEQSWVQRTLNKNEEVIQFLNYKPKTSDEIIFYLEDPK